MRVPTTLVVTALLVGSCVSAPAAVPKTLNYQGVLTTAAGVPLEGRQQLTFKIYDVETGGAALWTEADSLTLTHGIFNAVLGLSTPLNLAFDKTYWIGTALGADPEMAPRARLTASPYAGRAAVADSLVGFSASGAISGTPGYVSKFTGTGNTLGNSLLYQSGTAMAIGGSSTDLPESKLDIKGTSASDDAILTLSAWWNPELNFDMGGGDADGKIHFRRADNGHVFFDVIYDGSEGKLVFSDPNVGTLATIGTTGTRVYGTMESNAFKMATGGFGAGKVLTSDASGVGTWQSPVGTGDITAVYADNGLTGTVTSGDAHLNVGAGDGIVVAADAVAVDVASFAGSGLIVEGTNDLKVSPGTGLELSADAVQLTTAYSSGSAYDSRFLNQSSADVMSASASGGTLLTITNTGMANSSHALWVTSGSGSNSWAIVARGNSSGGGISSASTGWHGIHTTTSSIDPTHAGIWASNTGMGPAGYFSGNVNITGLLTKGAGAFKIDHPLDPANKYLYHSFVESPDMKNIYDGMVVLDEHGEASVELPDWFEPLNRDFRYQLTAVGGPGPGLFVAQEIDGNRFRIAGGSPGLKVSWQVTGIRHDRYANAHRIPVEETKPAADQGLYLHPDAFGLPQPMGVTYRNDHLDEGR